MGTISPSATAADMLATLQPYERAELEWLARVGPIPLWEWVQQVRPNLKPNLRADWTRFKFLAGIYRCTERSICVKKPAQSGVSEWAISLAFWTADALDGTVLYLFPTDVALQDFSQARFNPAVEASPYLQQRVIAANAAGGARGADRTKLKRVGNRFIYLRGAQLKPDGSAPQLKSVDADAVIYDECDEMAPGVYELGEKRLGASALGHQVWLSTPTYDGFGIDALYEDSDQRHWLVRCDGCGRRQALTIRHVVLEFDTLGRPARWHGQADGRAWCACEKCGRELDRLADGEWVSAFPSRTAVRAGFHFNKLCVPTAVLWDAAAEIPEQGTGILNRLMRVSPKARQEAYNQDLAETYTPDGRRMTDAVLDACRRDYALRSPSDPLPDLATEQRIGAPARDVWMGVDVGMVLHIVVRGGAFEGGNRDLLWAGQLASFDELHRMMQAFQVTTAVIDANPERRAATAFQRAFPQQVWLAFYPNMAAGTRGKHFAAFSDSGPVTEDAPWYGRVDIDRTWALDEMLARFFATAAGRSGNTLPADIERVADYHEHLKAPLRVEETTGNGVRVARYIHRSSQPDHFAHAEVYCLAAQSAPRKSGVWTM